MGRCIGARRNDFDLFHRRTCNQIFERYLFARELVQWKDVVHGHTIRAPLTDGRRRHPEVLRHPFQTPALGVQPIVESHDGQFSAR